jgi:hypothetical protein
MPILRCSRGKRTISRFFRTADLSFDITFLNSSDIDWFVDQVENGVRYFTVFYESTGALVRFWIYTYYLIPTIEVVDGIYVSVDVKKFTRIVLYEKIIKKIHDRDWETLYRK